MGGNVLVLAQHETPEEGALALASELARRLGATLVIAEHADESLCPAGSRGHRDVALQDTATYAHLEWLRQGVSAISPHVRTQVLRGEMPDVLSDALSSADILVAIDPEAGADARRRSRMLALEAAWRAGVPALALPARWPRPDTRWLLLAYDGSPTCRTAFPLAAELARASGWRIVLLQVIPVETARLPRRPEVTQILRQLREAVLRELSVEAAVLSREGIEVSARVMVGSPASSIVRAAGLLRAAMVVLGSRGRAFGVRETPGSVAMAVFLRSPVPCLLVPPHRPLRR
jgi:nucleotide-binding universal stress UspA family protein